jgi:predicted outer membrane protein
VAVVANQNDIDFSGIAMQKSHIPKILECAQTMMTDHKAIIDLVVALVTKLKVTTKDYTVSKRSATNTHRLQNSLYLTGSQWIKHL